MFLLTLCSQLFIIVLIPFRLPFLFHTLRQKWYFIFITIGLDDFCLKKKDKKPEKFPKSFTFLICIFLYHFPQPPVPASWWPLPWQIKKSSCCQRNSLFVASIIWNNFFTSLHLINSPYWLSLVLHISSKSLSFSLVPVCAFTSLSLCSILVSQSLMV